MHSKLMPMTFFSAHLLKNPKAKSIYMRKLPEHLVPLNSFNGKKKKKIVFNLFLTKRKKIFCRSIGRRKYGMLFSSDSIIKNLISSINLWTNNLSYNIKCFKY